MKKDRIRYEGVGIAIVYSNYIFIFYIVMNISIFAVLNIPFEKNYIS